MMTTTKQKQTLAPAILDQAADAVNFADVEGVIRIWNVAAAQIFGFAAEEATGRSLDLIIPEDLAKRTGAGSVAQCNPARRVSAGGPR